MTSAPRPSSSASPRQTAADRLGEPLRQRAQQRQLDLRHGHAEVVDPGRRRADAVDLVRPLVDDATPMFCRTGRTSDSSSRCPTR